LRGCAAGCYHSGSFLEFPAVFFGRGRCVCGRNSACNSGTTTRHGRGDRSLARWRRPTRWGCSPATATGPEVLREGMKVLDAAAQKFGFKFETTNYDIGGERYLKTGEILPDSVLDEFRKQDVLFLGAIGHPDVKPGILEKGILLKARFELEQYINLRPVKLYPGVETPIKDKGPEGHRLRHRPREHRRRLHRLRRHPGNKGTPNEVAIQNMIYTRTEVDRCLRYAFEYARKRNKDEEAHPRRQDERVDLRVRPLGARLPRDGPRNPGHQDRLRPRRRPLHVDGQEPRVVRRDRDGQPVRRHHHRPGRHDPGRHGHRGRRQHQPRRASRCSSRSAAPRRSTPA
jgi:hypothetical protein